MSLMLRNLVVDLKLQLLDVFVRDKFEQHVPLFFFKLAESALLRFLDVTEFFQVFEVNYVVKFFVSQFLLIHFLLLAQKLVREVH